MYDLHVDFGGSIHDLQVFLWVCLRFRGHVLGFIHNLQVIVCGVFVRSTGLLFWGVYDLQVNFGGWSVYDIQVSFW